MTTQPNAKVTALCLALIAASGWQGLAQDAELVRAIPRTLVADVAELDFAARKAAWQISETSAQLQASVLTLAVGGKAERRQLLGRGSTPMQGRRYLLTVEVQVVGAQARGYVSLRCGSAVATTIVRAADGWQEAEAIIDTAPYFPGQDTSSVLFSLYTGGAGAARFRRPRLFLTPNYGIHLRYRVTAPTTGEFTGRIDTIRRHRNTGHEDPVRHRYFSGITDAEGLQSIMPGKFGGWVDLRRYLFGTRNSTVSLKLRPAGDAAGVVPVTATIELACHVGSATPTDGGAKKPDAPILGEDDETLALDEPVAGQGAAARAEVFFRQTLSSENGYFLFSLPESDTPPTRFLAAARSLDQEIATRCQWAMTELSPPAKKDLLIPIGANLSRLRTLLGPQAMRQELQVLARIGIRAISRGSSLESTLFDGIRQDLYGQQRFQDRTYLSRLDKDERFSPYDGTRLREAMDRKYAALAKTLRWSAPGNQVQIAELTDEPGNQSPAPADLPAFRAFLQQSGLAPEAFGAAAWADVLPDGFVTATTPDELPAPAAPDIEMRADDEAADLDLEADPVAAESAVESPAPQLSLAQRRLRYYTRLFCAKKTSDFYKTVTAAVEKHLPGALTSVNFRSGHRRVLTPETADWFQFGRDRSVTMLWNEDWLNTYGWRNNGIQLVSYYVEMMRTASRKHNLPIGGFLMSYWGQAELKSYSALAHGSRYLYYWRYGPAYANYLSYSWSHKRNAVEQIATVCRDVARLEDTLVEARREPAATALLYAKADPVWGRSQTENRLVFMALLHDQIPVDIVTEAQIEEDGLLDQYRLLYVTDTAVRRKTLAKVAAWVADGGRVWLSGGAATRDEYDEPCPVLTSALGVDCAPSPPHERVIEPGADAPTAKTTSQYTLSGGKVALRFVDGAAAQVIGAAGKGEYCVSAFRPGALYEATVRPHFNRSAGKGRIQSGWRPERRGWITDFALRQEGLRPVRLDRPCVEAVLYRHPGQDIVMLINYTGAYPETPMQASVNCPRRVREVSSLRHGAIEFEQAGGWVRFALPIIRGDAVLLRY